MLHVFLKNKLVSSDAIVPVLLDARKQGLNTKIRFYVQSPKTLHNLRENTVLWAALNHLGDVFLAVPQDRSMRTVLRHRVAALGWMSGLALSLFFDRARIIHFGQLYTSRIYRPLIELRRRSVLVVEGAFAGFSKEQTAFAGLNPQRKRNFDISIALNVAVFEKDSELAKRVRAKGRTPVVIGQPHALDGWNDFLHDHYTDAFPPEHKQIFSVILGTFGKLDFFPEDNTAEELLEDTLEILIENGEGRPIYLKPHAITDLKKLDEIIDKYKKAPVIVTHLHPSVLAERAVFTIANYYSTVLSTVHGLGGITVEYTDYSKEALELTGGESMRQDSVTHFILRDRAKLKDVTMYACANRKRSTRVNNHSSVPVGLVKWFAGQSDEVCHHH